MKYTPIPPTVEGWYWYCERRPDGTLTKGRLTNVRLPLSQAYLGGNIPFWAGPIPKPDPIGAVVDDDADKYNALLRGRSGVMFDALVTIARTGDTNSSAIANRALDAAKDIED